MKRILIGLLIVLAVVALGGHYYYERQVEKRVENAARLIGQMGGNLDYREVSIELSGDISVEDIALRVPGFPVAISIDRAAVHTGGVLGVHRLALDAREQRLPTGLGVSFEGIRIPLSSVTQANGSDAVDGFSAAGCGDRRDFSALDIVNMGYSEFVMDTRIDYRLVGDGELLSVTIDTLMRKMHNTRVELDFSLGAPSRHAPAVLMAMRNAEILAVAIDYQDMGYAQRIMEFCTEDTGMDRATYVAQHLDAWQDIWKHYGLVAGPEMIKAYEQFVANPDELRLRLKPHGSLYAEDLSSLSPELLLQYLQIQVSVNQGALAPLDLRVMDETASQAWRAERRAQSGESDSTIRLPGTTESSAPDDRRIAVENLRNYPEAMVELRLTNGRTLEGVIHAFGDGRLHLQRFQSGGYLIQPVNYSDIEEAYLKEE